MPQTGRSFFHLHLVSDATGETLMAVARAAAAQYTDTRAVEHVYPLVRSDKQMDRVLSEIEAAPGIVLYTMIDNDLSQRLQEFCRQQACPCVSVLDPVLDIFRSYLGMTSTPRAGAQHVLNAEYFRRIDALNFTMLHDDGQLAEDLNQADVVLLGISRTSKTPTSIYLANRGVKTANIPLVPDIPPPHQLFSLTHPLVVGLVASPDRIVQIRQNRLEALSADTAQTAYVDRLSVGQEIAQSRKLCADNGWPLLDVTRRSIEETAAAIISLLQAHQQANTAPDYTR
ncbi:pyruvate, water dikinase regulatory protein [Candidatus Raskinella chloraquaticus]|uniref:Putative pyruvate, phosphate dikinase regulatory protein n=1 Tax=Candidatus Raskinella chloraquaticus TaxID=1951219 RepID=A0A1W9HYX3_9HYPH|nr:MAG: phosphoenolpyruvate synthase regulatory protein [Proteobacteria bacterium SG_bin8]